MEIRTVDRIFAVMLIAVISGCGYWATMRIAKEKRQLRQQNELIAKRVSDVGLAETNLKEVKQTLSSVKTELKILNERIPMEAEIGTFVQEVGRMVKQRNLSLMHLEPMPVVEEKSYKKIPVRVTLEGRFADIYLMIGQLETMNRMLVLDQLTLSRKEREALCRAEFTAAIFER